MILNENLAFKVDLFHLDKYSYRRPVICKKVIH